MSHIYILHAVCPLPPFLLTEKSTYRTGLVMNNCDHLCGHFSTAAQPDLCVRLSARAQQPHCYYSISAALQFGERLLTLNKTFLQAFSKFVAGASAGVRTWICACVLAIFPLPIKKKKESPDGEDKGCVIRIQTSSWQSSTVLKKNERTAATTQSDRSVSAT